MTTTKNVLVACEFSGVVRDAFLRRGHNAISCDLLPTESTGVLFKGEPELYVRGDERHHQGDVFDVLADPERWFGRPIDLMVAHPPCTFLTGAGARWLYQYDPKALRTITDDEGNPVRDEARWTGLQEGAEFFRALLEADVPRIAVENPVMMGHAKRIIGRGVPLDQTQTFQPYQFGHTENKRVALWLRNLPPLVPTRDVKAETMALPYSQRSRVHSMGPGPDRQKERSRFFTGVAEAMADQWGDLP